MAKMLRVETLSDRVAFDVRVTEDRRSSRQPWHADVWLVFDGRRVIENWANAQPPPTASLDTADETVIWETLGVAERIGELIRHVHTVGGRHAKMILEFTKHRYSDEDMAPVNAIVELSQLLLGMAWVPVPHQRIVRARDIVIGDVVLTRSWSGTIDRYDVVETTGLNDDGTHVKLTYPTYTSTHLALDTKVELSPL